MPKFDVGAICQGFQGKQFPERAELVKEFTKAMEHPSVKMLAAEIGAHAVDNNANPLQVLGLGLMYGMVIGVLCEKYRRKTPNE
jgi:hypothetical protein